jgi:hypothetical protein
MMDPICKLADERVMAAIRETDPDRFAKVDAPLRARMHTEIAALRKDAERYRWLRHGDNDDHLIRRPGVLTYLVRGVALDDACDAGIARDADEVNHTAVVPERDGAA